MTKFPIIAEDYRARTYGPQEYVPAQVVLMHENQCFINHGQSVATLAKRGGLSWRELFAVIHDVKFRAVEKVSEADCRQYCLKYCEAIIEQEETK